MLLQGARYVSSQTNCQCEVTHRTCLRRVACGFRGSGGWKYTQPLSVPAHQNSLRCLFRLKLTATFLTLLRDTDTHHTRNTFRGQLALVPLQESTSPPGCLALEGCVCVFRWLGPQYQSMSRISHVPSSAPLRAPLGLQHIVLLCILSTCSRPADTGYVFTGSQRTTFCFEYALKASTSRPSATYYGPRSLARGFAGIYHVVHRKFI
ncbi:hypothetical protein BDN71DRAFT_1455276 [Pleurotus eryngii]|uniref:Uncharacterized protein n=1 Tax=Pleurotus eryngii TaxID=5323 RepID=A0A9P5ZMA3_PLEER|nr:hypothetical protein BDN71DRAFT_1455276 [Pleurotus eryngii]